MKIVQFIFRENKLKQRLYLNLNLVEVPPLIQTAPNLVIDLKNSGKWNKSKQDEIYFRQRSLRFKSTQIFKQKIKKKVKKSLAYKLFFNQEKKKSENSLNYTNLIFLKIYLTKYGKIRSRNLTKLRIYEQSTVSRLIRKARSFKLIPLKFNVLS
jgi:ribosomal protein S18